MTIENIIDRDLRTLAEHLPFDVWVRDLDNRIVYANPVAQARWGLPIGSRPQDDATLPTETLALWLDNNRRALAGEVVRGEARCVVDGRERRVLNIIAPVRGPDGLRGTVGMNIDITDQRESEARAERLGSLLRDLFAHAPIAIGIREVRGDDLVHVEDNPHAAAILDLSPDDTRGKTDRELGFGESQVRRAIELYRRASARNEPLDFEFRFEARKTPHVMHATLVPLPVDSPTEGRFAFFGEDITRLRELEAGLTHADRLALLGVLAASIGHEIKNPAAYASTHLELLARRLEAGTLDDSARADLLESVRTALFGLERIVGLVRDMMRFASPRDAALGPVDLRDVIESVLKLASGEIRGRAHLVRTDADAPLVHANAMRLAQVVLNLVTNSLQAFGERRGTIWIATERANDRFARLTLADDGPGLPAEVKARLFQPFVTSGGQGRNGLGLFVSYDIVQAMGGTMRADARPGGGTIFTIEIPIHVGAAEPRSTSAGL
jgi:signal transduction histidine kinase